MTTATKEQLAKKPTELSKTNAKIVDDVELRISQLTEGGMLHLPPNYSAPNALRAAWLLLQEAKTSKQHGEKPVLTACTRVSIANSLFSMVVQALDPGRNQAYFIAHGNRLTLRRSYFGTLAIAKRVADVKDVYADVIYEGDEFEFETRRGVKHVTKHVQSLASMGGKIAGAYAVVEFNDSERQSTTEIMTWAEIQKAWAKGGKSNPARDEFPGEMSKRSVINRALKRHINSSDDEHLALLLEHVNRTDLEAAHDEVGAEADEYGNQEYIDVDVSELESDEDQPQLEAADETVENQDGAPPEQLFETPNASRSAKAPF